MRKNIGQFDCGYVKITVYVKEGRGGCFYIFPDKEQLPYIEIGVDDDSLGELITVLHHEVYELVYTFLGNRYTKTCKMSSDASRFIFHMSHNEFSEGCCWASEAITKIQPLLTKEYNIFKIQKKKKN
ncbi:MAG: hypothetical protein GY751_10740 [Bacteroidetes bacterium]|nr:hypothetical protein [Bacteroidota bacterium]